MDNSIKNDNVNYICSSVAVEIIR